MTPEQRRYVKKLQQIINRFDKLDDTTTRRTLAMLKTYRAHLADELLSAGTDWRVHQLTELQRSVDQMTTGFESQLTADLRAAQLQASEMGAALAVEPLQAAGLRGVFLSPSPAQVNTLLDFSAELIRSIGNDMRSGINRQLQLAILGERGPVDAMKAVTQVLGIDAQYGVWKTRRDPARGIAARAETIVRTEMNRIYNVSHQAQQTAMAETTPGLLKRWIATPDARTRPSHLAAHRRYMDEPIPVDEPFRVGGWDLMYPGDPGGPAAETISCRCRSITIHPLVGNVSLGTDDRIRAEQEKRGQVAAEKKGEQGRPLSPNEQQAKSELDEARNTYKMLLDAGDAYGAEGVKAYVDSLEQTLSQEGRINDALWDILKLTPDQATAANWEMVANDLQRDGYSLYRKYTKEGIQSIVAERRGAMDSGYATVGHDVIMVKRGQFSRRAAQIMEGEIWAEAKEDLTEKIGDLLNQVGYSAESISQASYEQRLKLLQELGQKDLMRTAGGNVSRIDAVPPEIRELLADEIDFDLAAICADAGLDPLRLPTLDAWGKMELADIIRSTRF